MRAGTGLVRAAVVVPLVMVLAAACQDPRPGTSAHRTRPARPARPTLQSGRLVRQARHRRAASCRSLTPSTPSTRRPRKGCLGQADVLVYDPDSLSDETIKAIRALDGVTGVESLALAQVSIENKVINVAAVDPGTYRNFTVRHRRDAGRVGPGGRRRARDPAGVAQAGPDRRQGLRAARQRQGRPAGAHRRVRAAGPAGRRGRQRLVDRDAGHEARQRAARTDGADRPGVAAQADRADRRWEASVQMLDAVARFGLDTKRPADGVPRRHGRRRGGHVQLHRARGRPDRPGPGVGVLAHRHRNRPDPRLGDLQPADLPPARGGAARDRGPWPGRRDPLRTSTPAATTRASSPARPRCPTTPSAWRSTSTCPATSAARSARWTGRSCRSSRSGASPGAATGPTPTRCTSR